MALHLKRITWPYDGIRCSITKKLLAYGDYYYEDDEDGLIVDYNYYHDRKEAEEMQQALNNPIIQGNLDAFSYQVQMKEAERAFLERDLFSRPLATDLIKNKNGDKNDK